MNEHAAPSVYPLRVEGEPAGHCRMPCALPTRRA